MGNAHGHDLPGIEDGIPLPGASSNSGPRNPDGTWMAGVERGPYKSFPIPIGTQVGALTITDWRRAQLFKSGGTMYEPFVRCECGWEGFVARSNLIRGRSTRCNTCAKKKSTETRKHYFEYAAIVEDAQHRARLLNRIYAIIARCENPNAKPYPDYGGRGIRVFPEWVEDRAKFLRYLVTLDGWDNPELQLDRRDNDKGYEPGNLRFCTRSANMANKRKIKARDVEELKRKLAELERENADLRHQQRRAEE